MFFYEKFENNNLPSPKILEFILKAKNILILSHYNPDGDALGSVTALALALKQLNKKADLFVSGFYSDSLNFLLTKEITTTNLETKINYDLVFLVDCHSLNRLEADEKVIENYLKNINYQSQIIIIDHHLVSDKNLINEYWLYNPQASSAGELMYGLLEALKVEFTFPLVQSLLTAIISDTGSFSQANATVNSFLISSKLLALGGRVDYIYNNLYRNYSLKRMLLLGEGLSSLKLHASGQIATIFLTSEMLENNEAEIKDAQGFVEYARNIKGVQLAAFFRVTVEGQVKVSMRSQENIRADKVAIFFGGGGHKQAAAYVVNVKTPQQALESFLKAALDLSGIKELAEIKE